MHRRAVAVVAHFIRLPGCEVERPRDFLVEQNVAHRILNIGVKAKRKFADVTRAGVGIENFVQPLGVARSGFDDLAVLEFEPDVFKPNARINRRRVELNHAVHRVFDRTGKDFAVGDVSQADARLSADAFDAEREVSAGSLELDAVGLFHPLRQGHHGARHLAVVHGADVEIKILKRFGAHIGRLRHARCRPAQDAPARLVHAIIQHRPERLRVKRHQIAGDIGRFAGVVTAADGDVGLNFFHAEHLDVAYESGVLVICSA